MSMSNILSEVHPELVAEWSDKNLPLTPDRITYGSNKVVWWKGACGHEWQTSVKARSNGENCPICSGARVIEGINDLATLKPELADEWSSKNDPLKPTMVTTGSHKKVIWQDKYGHEWTATVKSRALNGTGCPYCSHNKILVGFNDLASQRPQIASEWSERNYPLKPDMVTVFANRKVWWRCSKGHEWNTLISTRSGGSGCPYKEEQIKKDKSDGIKTEARYTTVNEVYELWKELKRGLKNNTFENYKYMYETFVRHQIGSKTVSSLKKTDIKRFYNYLTDERQLKPSTIDSIHTVLHQILDMAVDDDYIRNNPSDNVLRELKQAHCFKTEKRRALTRPEQELFLSYLKNTPAAQYWYPIFAVLVGTGLRVGELTGLRWCDVDLEDGVIDVNHTLVYYDHRTDGSKKGCYFNVNTPKTPAGKRKVPMLSFVKEAIIMEKERQELLDLHCIATIDGYTDFIFINRFGNPQHQGTLNKAIRRIIRDCNDEQFLKNENPEVLLPHFSCHSLRHTFTTRMCEAGVNVKVIQDTLGHKDISTTLNIYTDVTKELRQSEFEGLDSYFKSEYNKVSNE